MSSAFGAELVPLLASALIAAPTYAFEPCYATSGDSLRCGGADVRVRGLLAGAPGTEAGDAALEALQRKMREGRVRTSLRTIGPGGGIVADVYVSEALVRQRHIGPRSRTCDATGRKVRAHAEQAAFWIAYERLEEIRRERPRRKC